MMRIWTVLCCMVLVAGCSLSRPERAEVAENPVTGAEIAVTTLDAPLPDTVNPPEVIPPAKPEPVMPEPVMPEPEILPVPADPPPQVMTPEEQACFEKGGLWGAVGSGGTACMYPTRDAGKQCRRESDCDGYCLARSGTCAPYTPMFGCNEIVQDNGVVVTLCID
jgi:hypothetical protein